MKQKEIEPANLAWISRFWALYGKLPENFKEGFYSLAVNISKEIDRKEIDKRSVSDEKVW